MSESNGAVLDEVVVSTKTKKRPQAQRQREQPQQQPRYHVVLWDDSEHTYEYVISMLQQLFGHPFERSYELAKQVDANGSVICLTTTKEHAELKRDQIHAWGKDPLAIKCSGSMSASIEAES